MNRDVIVAATVLAVCALLLSSANMVVEAKTVSTLTISAPSSAKVNQPFSITGTLTANGAALTKQTVSLQRLSSTTWTTIASQTATTGTYSFSRTETTAATYQYRTTYGGGLFYASAATSPTTAIIVAAVNPTPTPTPTPTSTPKPTPTPTPKPTLTPTQLSLSVTNATPYVNQSVTFTAALTNGTTPLASKSVTIYHSLNGVRTNDATAASNSNGHVTLTTRWASPGLYTYYATFAGDSSYQTSTSSAIAVNVTAADPPAPTPTPTPTPTSTPTANYTAVTITASNAAPAVNQSFSLLGTLMVNGTPLSGKTVTLGRYDPSGAWSAVATTTTNSNGAYTFTRSESAQGVYSYHGYYNTLSSPLIAVTVGTPTPTAITIAASTAAPSANQSFILAGTLTANGTPLSGKTITLGRTDPSGNYTAAATTTTNANGTYTFTRSESSGVYTFYAVFSGDTYARASASLTLTIGTLQKSAITIVATNYTPAVNQSYTVSGFLQDGVSGAPLAGQRISLLFQGPSAQNVSIMTTTDSTGAYTFTRSESAQGSCFCTVLFRGNSIYSGSMAMLELTVGHPIPTSLSLNVKNNNPNVNQSFAISGHLTGMNGTALAGRTLVVSPLLPTGNYGTQLETATDSNGYYSSTLREQTSGQYRYEVSFLGDSTYKSFTNSTVVAVGTLQSTNLSLQANIANPGAGKPFKLSAKLTDVNGTPLAQEKIALNRYVVGQPLTPGAFSIQQRYTDQNGVCVFELNESTAGMYMYSASFTGDQTHALSNASLTLTVGTLTTTTTTITASTTRPEANQSFTLSGALIANGTPLSGKTVSLGRYDPSGAWSTAAATTTDANGTYAFPRSESLQGIYHYHAYFSGDPPYNASSSPLIVVTVGTLSPTTITITASTAAPSANQSFTLSGALIANGTPLSGKTITLGRIGPSGNYTAAATTTTNANGTYTFTRSESQGVYTFYAVFSGDTYARASASLTLTVRPA